MNTEQRLRELKRELQALKATFLASATQINLFTKTTSFDTKKNSVTVSGFTYEDQERVVVTFTTTEGVNTLAKLEISGNYDLLPYVRRVPYANGARWVVSNAAKMPGGSWTATHYDFTIQSLVNGTATAAMIWEV